MLKPRTAGIASVGTYFIAMCLPAIAAKSYYKTYLLHGWEATYMCVVLAFAPSMNWDEKGPLIVGTLANVLFLFGIASFLGREFWHWSRPSYMAICWISALCLVCSLVSVSMVGTSQNSLLIGFYFWIVSSILLFLGSCMEWWRQRKPF